VGVTRRQPLQGGQRRGEARHVREGACVGGRGELLDVDDAPQAFDAAGGRGLQPGEYAPERGLAAAVRTDQADRRRFDRLVQVGKENAPVGQDDVDPVQGRKVRMRHV